MRNRWLVTAIFAAFALSACGNRGSENGGSMAEEPPLTGTERLTDGGSVAEESPLTGTERLTDGGNAGGETASAKEPGPAQSQAEPQAQDRSIVAEQEGYAGTLQVTLPEGWTCETCPEDSDQLRVGDYGIHFYPEEASEGFIELCYVDFFGVCGTGLEEKTVTLAGDTAHIGTYDHGENWDFVSFQGTNKGIVALTYAVEGWWPEYGEEVLEILETVCLIPDHEDGTGDICGYPLAPQSAESMQTIACGTNQEPQESLEGKPEEDSRIQELGLSLEVTECTGTGATLVFRQSGGNPAGELIFGDAYGIERYENGEWLDVPVAITGNYAFHEVAYVIPQGEEREFQIDWEWLYGELGAGEYRIRKEVDDFRKTADYDEYEIYAYFEIRS